MKATVWLLYAYSKSTLEIELVINHELFKHSLLVGLQLIVQSRLSQRRSRIQALIEHMPQILDGRRDDTAAACGPDNKVKGAVGEKFHDGR